MGIASVIIGILGILLSWIPCLWPIVAIHVVIGLGLGYGDLLEQKRASQDKPLGDEQVRQSLISVSVAGIWLNVIAGVLAIAWQLFWRTMGF